MAGMHQRTSDMADGRIVPITSALGLGIFLMLFDVTAVVVAMPGLAKDLGLAVAGAAWVIDAYSLAFTGALLASGALADRFGRRRSMLTGNAVFLAASIACGLSTDGAMLLASRVVQGAGAAFVVTGAIALVAGEFPDPGQRARAFGIIGVISGVAMALGPTLGGLLASWFGWRWIFYANIPFCLLLTFAVPRLVAEANDPNAPPLDPVAIALLTISLGLTIDALLRRDGSLPVRAACLAGGAMAAIMFVVQQRRSSRPVLDPRVFATPVMAGVGALLTAIQFGYWAVIVYLPLFLSAGLLVSMEVAGVALLAATLPMLPVPLIGGHLVTRWGWKRFFVIAFGLIAAGDALLALAAVCGSPVMRLAATVGGMLTIGVGAALANPQMSSVVLALAPPTQTGMASAVTLVVRQAGFAISIAALGATLARADMATAFAAPFALATLAALAAIVAAIVLLPARASQKGAAN
ncbi:MFS transporter [Bradyrhizobium roseum]|uniref:MFS transporter n=1 Tax=Bradyrhizobium roseum TaxID=3056648 RepID=UPI002A4E2973|nr:MFS transporter [Bradyrhizobium roseus]